mmetsp:Transcript_14829/g.43278  ORF Transcript_14829/g.43278 Transcript_14829/m.43278 type:complete len:273 (-) Transcript_14829:1343-2161(-)
MRKDQDSGAVSRDGRLSLLADLVEPLAQQRLSRDGTIRSPLPRDALVHRVRHVEDRMREASVLQIQERVEAARAQDRRVQEDAPAGLRGRVEQVPLWANGAHQRHDVGLPDGVDGRVRGLGKQLREEVERRARQSREACQGHVLAHGAQGLVPRLHHRRNEHLQLFVCVAKVLEQWQDTLHDHGLLQARAGVLVQQVLDEAALLHLGRQPLLQLEAVVLEVLRKGQALRIAHLQLHVIDEPARAEVNQEHLPRPEPALELNLRRRHIHDADL